MPGPFVVVTVSPGPAVMFSKLGTPVIVIDTVSSLSTGVAVTPIGIGVPGCTDNELETVRLGASVVSAPDGTVMVTLVPPPPSEERANESSE